MALLVFSPKTLCRLKCQIKIISKINTYSVLCAKITIHIHFHLRNFYNLLEIHWKVNTITSTFQIKTYIRNNFLSILYFFSLIEEDRLQFPCLFLQKLKKRSFHMTSQKIKHWTQKSIELFKFILLKFHFKILPC